MANANGTPNSQTPTTLSGGGTATEQAVAKIWTEVLRLPTVNTTDDFFNLGGDSMKAMEVIARISQDLRVELPLMAFFEDPTVAHLASVLDEMLPSPTGPKAELTKIWLDVLRIPSVAANADFFTIGGDSMKAMEVIAQVNQTLGVELPLMSFFEDPTINHLAAVLDELIPKSSPSEQALTKIWREVLRVENIAPTADFFDIGGDSMKAMEVVSQINDLLHVELPLMSFFEDPTIAHLASVLDELASTEAPTATQTIVKVPGRKEFPLSYSQQVFWLLEQQNNNSGLYNTARVFFLHGDVDATILERALNEVRNRHEIFQVRIVLGNDGPMQIVDPGAPLTLSIVDVSNLDGTARDQAAQQHTLTVVRDPLNLETGPPLRAKLIHLTATESILAMAIHHVVSDGFTASILLDELRTLYDAFAAGQPSPLPAVEVHFTDFAAWERETLTTMRLDEDLDYWRPVLAGVPTSVDLPSDHNNHSATDREGHLRTITLPAASLHKLQALAQASGATLFTVLNAAFRALIYRFSGQSDFLIGTISSNRSRARTERMVGCFVNSLPLRNPILEGQTALDLIASEKTAVMNAFAHQDCPFAKIVEAANPERSASDNPLFNVALLYQSYPAIGVQGQHWSADDANFDAEIGLIDLRFIAFENKLGLQIDCEFRSAVFEIATVDKLLAAYTDVLMQIAATPAIPAAEIALPPDLATRAAEHTRSRHRQTLSITANFTADPVAEPLAFWMDELRIPSNIELAPFDQIFQQLLDPTSLLTRNTDGANILFLQWREGHAEGAQARELATALKSAAARGGAPIIVCICPPEASVEEQILSAELAGQIGVHVIYPHEILSLYPVENYRDEYAESVGAIPYTPDFFVALASITARRIYGLRSTPYKVIALDCDNTLWRGVCGEEGPLGVEVDAPRLALQQFMLAHREAGMLLCLNSKNVEADVNAVFEQNPGMLLRPEHITASRINWQSKSENLHDLARHLNLGVDSIIFVDDNPLECAEVRANCPGALVLELPADETKIPVALQHLWAFDHWSITQEDRNRSELYRQEQQREQARSVTGDLDEFLRGLDLHIDIRPMQPDDLARVSQLTQRTNQFNCTTIRRSEAEITSLIDAGAECLIVNVRDRFGDYGLVGVTIFSAQSKTLAVDTLLMSCRALGRRVEHNILAHLGRIAQVRGLEHVDIAFAPTPKNRPAQDFLESLDSTTSGETFCFTTAQAVAAPEAKAAPAEQAGPSAAASTKQAPRADLARIAADLADVKSIAQTIRFLARNTAVETGSIKARTATEEIVGDIWAVLLHTAAPGIHDDFFRLGGNSLLAVQVISRVRQTLGVEMPLRAIFEETTLAGFAQRIESTRRIQTGTVTPPLVKTPRTSAVPASFAQQRLWFLDQLEPDNPIYNIPQMTRLRGALNIDALQRALTEIVRRHEALRTTFIATDGQPLQVIHPPTQISLATTDLSHLEAADRDAEVQRLALEEAVRTFDLAHGPVFRAQLLRTAPEEHILLVVLHHIVGDRWSAGILAEEMEALYAAYVLGQHSPLPDPSVQYADFSIWQRDWLQGNELDRQATYWKQQFAGAPALLEFPTDHPRPALLGHRGRTQTALLSADLVAKLTALSQTEGVTLFMTLLAGLQTLMSRYSNQTDIVVGSPIAGRNTTEVEQLIGFFVNTLALRSDLSGNPAFRDLLTRVKQTTLGAYSHQDIPFEKLVEELQPERSLSYQPIFQVVFALQNAPQRSLELAGLKLQRLPLHQGTSAFDMSWFATHVTDGMEIRVEYNTDLFEVATITRAIGHFQTLLEAIVQNPAQRICELPLLPADEVQTLRETWNSTEQNYPSDQTLAQLFEQQVDRSPDAIACIAGDTSFTYRDLNASANQLAHYLAARGIGPGSLVGICLHRTHNLLVALFGILKTGAAYLPLDPGYPEDRINYILKDAEARLVFTQQSVLDALPALTGDTLSLDLHLGDIALQSTVNPPHRGSVEDLAYVLHTSGSTGKPKGVEITQRNLVNFLTTMQHEPGMKPCDTLLAVTTLSFDIAGLELYLPLITGARVVISSRSDASDPTALIALMQRHRVSVMQATPATWLMLFEAGWTGDSSLKVLCGGEAISQELASKLSAATSELWNMYGPTETTIWSSVSRIPAAMDTPITIGRPIANTTMYVLDPLKQLVPIGVHGELYIGGDGVARGYWQRPELTAERFVASPFTPGARIYRTGDLAKFLPDGTIQCLGRIDNQIKIRGFRIELGEIETVLGAQPGIKDCVVVTCEDTPGNKRLVAYIVVEATGMPATADLPALLATSLPDYMVPHVYMTLDSLPLTPNGKVDRKALPAPDVLPDEAEYVVPRTDTEHALAAIWSGVLQINPIGATTNFFSLGGHSLLATQVISRIRRLMDVELPLRDIFEFPTIEGLAKRIDATTRSQQVTGIPCVSRDQPLALSFAQERLWFLDQFEPGNPRYNAPLPMRLKGPLSAAAMRDAINAIIRRHEVLRTTFRLENDRPVQEIATELVIDVPVIDISHLPLETREDEARSLAIEEARQPFNLRSGPVVRASLLRLEEQDHVLLLDIHHIATDGWSIWPFIQELGALYETCLAHLPSPSPELPIQYADFAVWQRDWIESDQIAAQLSYWKDQLADAPERIDLPTDRPRLAIETYRGATETVTFSTSLLKELNQLGQREGVTLYMTMLAAFQTLLHRYTGQDNIVVGSPIANRTRAEIEDLIGFFVNTLVMHTDVSGNPTFLELLQRVRTVALGAFANQDLPFEKLVEAIAPDRDLGTNPLVQVLFVMQNARRSVLRIADVEFEGMPIHNGTAKFDVGIFLNERPEGLICMAEYSTDLFDRATICRMLGHFETLLQAIVADPAQRIGELPILPAEEAKQVALAACGPQVDVPRDRSLHQFIEQHVGLTPDAPAVVFESASLTYAQLNSRANQLAHRLRKMGVGPDILVGICIERSIEMVVGLLAILKAGGAYVPLDPEYPRDRLGLMLADAEAPVLLTSESLLDVMPPHDVPTICLDRDWHTLATESTANPEVMTTGKNLAYVIYTSGSTGKPKGVPNVHEGIVNRLLWMQHAYQIDASDRILQKTPYSFDVSVWEFFWPLMTGACLVVAQPGGHKDPDYLVSLIQSQHITTLHFVPSMLRIFLETYGADRCTSIRRVVCSGEALPFDLQQRFFERLAAELHNLYGPTEAAVDVTYWPCTPDSGRTSVPIGFPIWNTQIRILDPHLHPVPFSIPGELHIGGRQLARGYLKRPDLTAEKFIPDPFSSESGARLYKSGDLARMLPDGTVEYLGRIDHQVKIRGFRIELGEIESILASNPAVRDTVVVAREDQPGDKYLVGYVVANTDYKGPEQPDSVDTLSAEQVAQWADTFDAAYQQGSDSADATFNIVGWDSSYTGEQIPAAQMKVWVNTTVDRILAPKPTAVWEIGCGTGLLMFPVAPRTSRYFGTDISNTSLTFLRQQLQRPELTLPQVSLERRPAHDFSGTTNDFDMIVVNSVAQYFPDLDYFLQVLTGAVETAGPVGSVFLGDLRSLPLLESFHTSVQLFRASNTTTVAELQKLVRKSVAQEGELVIDPDFFQAVRTRIPGIQRVEVQLKRGRHQNELTRFRYDVTLHLGPIPAEKVDCPWIDWQSQQFSLDLLRETLLTTQPAMLGITAVPNARLLADVIARDLMLQPAAPETIGEVREIASGILATQPTFEPEDFWALESEALYRVEVHQSRTQTDGCFDVILRRLTPAGESAFTEPRYPRELPNIQPLRSYANNPLRQRIAAQLVPQLRLWLGAKLPEYMVPQAIVVLDVMPLSANGKINRKALPAPEQFGIETAGTYVAPRTPTQEMLAAIFDDVLRLDCVGLNDNFFELGGHSLSATQVVSRVRQTFGVNLQVRALFESPTVATLSDTIEQMLRDKSGLLAPPIVKVPRDQPLPLSFAQQRLWVQDQMEPNNPLFNVPRALRLKGSLDVSALESALNGIVARHEVLRTTYASDRDGHPFQIIAPELLLPLPVVDLRDLPAAEREKEAKRLVQREAATPFQLASESITRNILLQMATDEHILVMNTHHIVTDGWSTGIIVRELGALYEAALQSKPSPLPDLPIQYADFAVWQRNWLQGEVLGQQVQYWKNRLEGAPPMLALPTDRPRAATSVFRGATHHFLLPVTLSTAVRGYGRQRGATHFMVLLAAFQCMILHFTRNPDVVLGTDLANRTNHQTEGLIGFFVNLLVLRTDLSGNPTFDDLLTRVREVALEAYAHQDVPFDKLVEELQPERSRNYHPLVQALFVQQNTPRNASPMPGIEMSQFPLDMPSKFDMAVFVTETDKGVSGIWMYDADLFDPSTIARMSALFQLVLETVTADSTTTISRLTQTLDQADQQQRQTQNKEFQQVSLQKLKSLKRRTVTIE